MPPWQWRLSERSSLSELRVTESQTRRLASYDGLTELSREVACADAHVQTHSRCEAGAEQVADG